MGSAGLGINKSISIDLLANPPAARRGSKRTPGLGVRSNQAALASEDPARAHHDRCEWVWLEYGKRYRGSPSTSMRSLGRSEEQTASSAPQASGVPTMRPPSGRDRPSRGVRSTAGRARLHVRRSVAATRCSEDTEAVTCGRSVSNSVQIGRIHEFLRQWGSRLADRLTGGCGVFFIPERAVPPRRGLLVSSLDIGGGENEP